MGQGFGVWGSAFRFEGLGHGFEISRLGLIAHFYQKTPLDCRKPRSPLQQNRRAAMKIVHPLAAERDEKMVISLTDHFLSMRGRGNTWMSSRVVTTSYKPQYISYNIVVDSIFFPLSQYDPNITPIQPQHNQNVYTCCLVCQTIEVQLALLALSIISGLLAIVCVAAKDLRLSYNNKESLLLLCTHIVVT